MPSETNTKQPTTLVPVPVPGTDNRLMAIQRDGEVWVSPNHVCMALHIDWKSQHRKLNDKPWASMVKMTMQLGGQSRELVMIDRRTLTMWLATIETSRIKDDYARSILEAYQVEAADALDSYFHEGAAINPRADEHQLNAIMRQSQMQMELCQIAKGLIHPDHLEAKARVILARGLGEKPELDPGTRPLYAQQFLKEKNLSAKQMRSKASVFGKRLKKAYVEKYGREPEKYDLDLSNGQTRPVNAYTEADRPLMNQVWEQYFEVPA